MVACNERFLVTVKVAVSVNNCAQISVGEKRTIADMGRNRAWDKADRICSSNPDCPCSDFVEDHHVILGECKNGIQKATYEGYFVCVECKDEDR